MRLFTYEGYEVVVDAQALMLAPFKAIWDRDKSKDKGVARQELSIIYFHCDPRSDYQYIVNKADRLKEIVKGLGMPDKWKADKKMQEAFRFYETFKSPAALLLEDIRLAVDKMRNTIREMDIGKDDLKDAAATVQKLTILVQDLNKAERDLNKENLAESKARGSQEKSILDDEFGA